MRRGAQRAICTWLAFVIVLLCAHGAVSTHEAAHSAWAGPSAAIRVEGNSTTWTRQWLLVDDVLHGSTAVANALQHRAQRLAIPPGQDGSSSQAGHGEQQQPSLRKVAMFIMVACTLILAAGGGMGGGAIFVPLYIVVGGFSTSQAVALSNITVLGGAVANLCFNLRRRHPSLPKPLIDWDLILVMEPTTILGALLGSYMNKLLPVWVTSVLLASLLTLLTVKLLRRAVKVAQAENAANQVLAQYREPLLHHQAEQDQLLPPTAGGAAAAVGGTEHPPAAVYVGGSPLARDTPIVKAAHPQLSRHDLSVDFGMQSVLQQVDVMHKGEQRQVPVWPLVIMLLLAGAVVSTDTLKSQLPCGSWQYWLLVLCIVPLCGTVTLLVRRHLLQKAALRQRAGVVRGEGELCWDARNTIVYPGICSTAGVVAGLFGVGGGIVKSPLMLELGVCPQVAAATSSTMIAFTAGSACVVYLNFGGLDSRVAAPLLALGFFATLLGQVGTSYLVKALGRKSLIICVMSALMFLSTLAAFYQARVNVEWVVGHMDQIWQGGQICGAAVASR